MTQKKPHNVAPVGTTGFYYCAKCGKVRLKNEASRKAWAKGCNR